MNKLEEDDEYYLDKMLSNKKIKYVFYAPFLIIIIFVLFLVRFVVMQVDTQKIIDDQQSLVLTYLKDNRNISKNTIKSITPKQDANNDKIKFKVILTDKPNIEYTLYVINENVFQKSVRDIKCTKNCSKINIEIAPVK